VSIIVITTPNRESGSIYNTKSTGIKARAIGATARAAGATARAKKQTAVRAKVCLRARRHAAA